jgi:PAS domain S-box-containing protein
LIRSFDWSRTPLGPIEHWSSSLKMATALLLQSPIAIVMLWGPEGVMIYNDAYSRFGGARHPGLLGRNVLEAWPEVADLNDHVLKVVLHGGKPLSYKDRELWLNRDGVSRQLWTDLDYSPVVDESGKPVGVFAVVTETTERVLADRRIAAERERQQLCWVKCRASSA